MLTMILQKQSLKKLKKPTTYYLIMRSVLHTTSLAMLPLKAEWAAVAVAVVARAQVVLVISLATYSVISLVEAAVVVNVSAEVLIYATT